MSSPAVGLSKVSIGKGHTLSSPPPLPVDAHIAAPAPAALHFDSPISELAYVMEKLRLAEEALEGERELRKLGERKLQHLMSETQSGESISPLKGFSTPSRRMLDSPGTELTPSRRALQSPRAAQDDAEESKAREERWSAIARSNKRKVQTLEAQARGDERRILRLERQLEAERAERTVMDQSYAQVLAMMEDALESLNRSSALDEDLKKIYSTARGISRSPNKTVREKVAGLTGAVLSLFSGNLRLADAKVVELEANLVEVHRHSQQLESALASKLDDLEKARVLFRQIVHLLPSGNKPEDDLTNSLLSPSSKQLGHAERERPMVEPLPASISLPGKNERLTFDRVAMMAQSQQLVAPQLSAPQPNPTAPVAAPLIQDVAVDGEPSQPSGASVAMSLAAANALGDKTTTKALESHSPHISPKLEPQPQVSQELPKLSVGVDHQALKERMRQKFEQKLSDMGVALL